MPSIPDYVRGPARITPIRPGINTAKPARPARPLRPQHQHNFTDSGWCLTCPTHQDGRKA